MRPRLVSSAVRGVTLAAAIAAGVAGAIAQPISREDLPPSLRPWVPWVLDQVPTLGCATMQGRPACLWPGQLELELGPDGGTFALALHGGSRGGRALRQQGALAAGRAPRRRLRARLRQRRHAAPARRERPPSPRRPLRVVAPARVPDRPIGDRHREPAARRPARARGAGATTRAPSGCAPAPRRRARARACGCRCSARSGTARRSSSRRGLELEVSGRAREVTLPGAILPGSVPVAVAGDLPARVENDTLRIQVRGGRYSVSVDARVEGRPDAIALPKGRPKEPGRRARYGSRRRRGAPADRRRIAGARSHRSLADRASPTSGARCRPSLIEPGATPRPEGCPRG